MKVLKFTSEINQNGQLKIDLPTDLKPGKVDLVIVVDPVTEKMQQNNTYDFADLEGELSWRGNAVDTQRELRNEW